MIQAFADDSVTPNVVACAVAVSQVKRAQGIQSRMRRSALTATLRLRYSDRAGGGQSVMATRGVVTVGSLLDAYLTEGPEASPALCSAPPKAKGDEDAAKHGCLSHDAHRQLASPA
jgi:hypothetical protein